MCTFTVLQRIAVEAVLLAFLCHLVEPMHFQACSRCIFSCHRLFECGYVSLASMLDLYSSEPTAIVFHLSVVDRLARVHACSRQIQVSYL